MLSFMFSVLGSVVFWVLFFGTGFIVGSIMIKHFAPLTWQTFKTGERPMSKEWRGSKADPVCMVLVCTSIYLFWPILLLGIIIWFLFKSILFPVFRKSAVLAGNIIPDIELKTKN